MNKPIYISIEGNISSGKSTLMNALKNICYESELCNEVCFIDEKINLWLQPFDEKGNSILDLFYSNPEKYSFVFQIQVLVDQLNEIKQKLLFSKCKYAIGERCLDVSRLVFAKMLFDSGKMSRGEWKLYNTIFDNYTKPTPDMIIYCDRSSSVCLENINKRARQGENKIDLGYLLQLEAYHNDFLETYEGNIKRVCINQCESEEDINRTTTEEAMKILASIME